MRTTFAAIALAATLVQPASATTFPTFTTIYVGSGVTDNGDVDNEGVATVFLCSNVSGVSTSIRFLLLSETGNAADSAAFTAAHGQTITVATHLTTTFAAISLSAPALLQGAVNIESLQSGVFCSAFIVDAADAGDMAPLHLVRVNPHPGTVE